MVKKLAARTAIIILTTLICMAVKTFTDFINIAGAIGSATVSFILPQLFYLREFSSEISKKVKIGCYMIIIFGVAGSAYSIQYSIRKLAGGDYS